MTRGMWAAAIGAAVVIGGTANAQHLGSKGAAPTVNLGGAGTTTQAATDAADNEFTRWGGYHRHHHGHYHYGYHRPHYYSHGYSYYRPHYYSYGYNYHRPYHYGYSYYRPHYHWRAISGDAADKDVPLTGLGMSAAEKADTLKAAPATVTNLKVSLPAATKPKAEYGFKAYGQK